MERIGSVRACVGREIAESGEKEARVLARLNAPRGSGCEVFRCPEVVTAGERYGGAREVVNVCGHGVEEAVKARVDLLRVIGAEAGREERDSRRRGGVMFCELRGRYMDLGYEKIGGRGWGRGESEGVVSRENGRRRVVAVCWIRDAVGPEGGRKFVGSRMAEGWEAEVRCGSDREGGLREDWHVCRLRRGEGPLLVGFTARMMWGNGGES
ncbi:hypothetical protein Tco_0568486 [Tanacetum coccineum]